MVAKEQTVLFLCTGNSCRSQMAEGFLNHIGAKRYRVVSAGTKPTSVHPLAIQVMREDGIDISGHTSKAVAKFLGTNFDYVITVCDKARDACVVYPAARKNLGWSFQDPAHVAGPDEMKLTAFRKVRDQIKAKVIAFVEERQTSIEP